MESNHMVSKLGILQLKRIKCGHHTCVRLYWVYRQHHYGHVWIWYMWKTITINFNS